MTTSTTSTTPAGPAAHTAPGVARRGRPTSHRHDGVLEIPAAPGERDQMPAAEILQLFPALPNWPPAGQSGGRARITAGGRAILEWLATHEGDGWQERWVSSGADRGMEWVGDLVRADGRGEKTARASLVSGLTSLILCRIIRPSYDFLNAYKAARLFSHARQVFCPRLFARLTTRARETDARGARHRAVLVTITKMVIHTGRDVDQLTAADVLTYRAWAMARQDATRHGSYTTHSLRQAWALLGEFTDLGHRSLTDAVRTGQHTTAELVDRHQLRCRPVRDMLVRYLDERRPGMDYSSFTSLATMIAGRFWADLELHHPGIDNLHLPHEVAEAWKQRIRTITNEDGTTRPRQNFHSVMLNIRAFYRDLQEWSLEDPGWAAWNVPSPIRRSDLAGVGKTRRRVTAQMHQRTRERLPHLPALVETVERHKAEQASFHTKANSVDTGQTFEHKGHTYRRIVPANYTTAYYRDSVAPLKALDIATGDVIDVGRAEHEAFWAWAVIEVLRHTGVRIEELLELTHLGIVSYQLPDTNEVVPMLQIVPSKTNEERLLLVSPELASVLATILSRLRTANNGTIPLTPRYDLAERVTGPALPHLFQHRPNFHWEVFSPRTIQKLLTQTLELTGLTDATGAPLHCTPHDFRRMFATDAVTGGLPIHITARLLGHTSLNTTQAYTAVFDEELVRNYRSFLDNRRNLRPEAEYREPTDQEWREFNNHFQLRKLELGECARPYNTPCKHEHACIRCPSLHLDHRAKPRLTEIIHNLRHRIQEAKLNNWPGEIKGLETSLHAATTKLTTLNRLQKQQTQPINLGIPTITNNQQPPHHHTQPPTTH
ncbi:tyrosine-type recombinase/integrase [Amycolatopsis japonica]|uniref:tyrosine-type recombinase/integrase n=1 Tax=Amycolatopsis japonica TaxID=208439 RepID=UPI00332A6C4A